MQKADHNQRVFKNLLRFKEDELAFRYYSSLVGMPIHLKIAIL